MIKSFEDYFAMEKALITHLHKKNLTKLVFVEDLVNIGFLCLETNDLFKIERADAYKSTLSLDKFVGDSYHYLNLVLPHNPYDYDNKSYLIQKMLNKASSKKEK